MAPRSKPGDLENYAHIPFIIPQSKFNRMMDGYHESRRDGRAGSQYAPTVKFLKEGRVIMDGQQDMGEQAPASDDEGSSFDFLNSEGSQSRSRHDAEARGTSSKHHLHSTK